MIKAVFLCLVVLCAWHVSAQAFGVAVASPTTTTAFSCLYDQGNSVAIVRIYKANATYQGIDLSGWQNLVNAGAAKSKPSTTSASRGFTVSAYMQPCRNSSDPSTQVQDMLSNTPARFFNTLYVKVIPCLNPDCSWESFTHQENCDFLTELLGQIKRQTRRRLPIGVFSTANIWARFFGNTCDTIGVAYPALWYANYQTNGLVNPSQSFNDFVPFGGWTKPGIKQTYGNTTATFLCGNNWHVFLDRVWTSNLV